MVCSLKLRKYLEAWSRSLYVCALTIKPNLSVLRMYMSRPG